MSKEIIIDGENSDWFEKAVFTLKDNQKVPYGQGLFEHAEQIVEMKLKKMPQSNNINSSKVNLNIRDANKRYMEQLKLGNKLKNCRSNRKRTEAIINIFLYSTLVFAFICIMCFIMTI